MNNQKLLKKILAGSKNIQIVNLQNRKGQVKPYQVRQFLQLVEQYDLELEG